MKKITIKIVHPKLNVKKKLIQLLVENILISEETCASVDVILVDDQFIRELNKKFTRKDKTTDVLSFGMKEGKNSAIEFPSLGDIYVNLDQAKRQAGAYRVSFDEEVRLLVAHGLLHLLGYEHKNKKEESVMRKKEQRYLKKA